MLLRAAVVSAVVLVAGCAGQVAASPARTVVVFGIGDTMDYTCGPTPVDICTRQLPTTSEGHAEKVTLSVGSTVRVRVTGGVTPTCLITDVDDRIAFARDAGDPLRGDSVAECSYVLG